MTNTLDELERLHADSTPGEWVIDEDWTYEIQSDGVRIGSVVRGAAPNDRGTDAAAIVALHNAFPALLAYVRALEAVAKLVEDGECHEERYIGTGEYVIRATADADDAYARLDAARAKLNGGK